MWGPHQLSSWPVTIFSFSLFSWSAAHATPFTQLLSEIQKRHLGAANENKKLKGDCECRERVKKKKKTSSSTRFKFRCLPKTPTSGAEAPSLKKRWPARSSRLVVCPECPRFPAAKSKWHPHFRSKFSAQKNCDSQLTSKQVLRSIYLDLQFSPHLTWFWVMKCDRLLGWRFFRMEMPNIFETNSDISYALVEWLWNHHLREWITTKQDKSPFWV